MLFSLPGQRGKLEAKGASPSFPLGAADPWASLCFFACNFLFISFEIERKIINKQMSYIIDKPVQKYFYGFLRKGQRRGRKDAVGGEAAQMGGGGVTRGIEQALRVQQTAFFTSFGECGEALIATEQYELGRGLWGLPSFSVSAVREEVNIKVDILSNNQQYFRIESMDHRLQLNRTLVFNKHCPPFKLFKVQINLLNGRLRLSLPLHFLFQGEALSRGSKLRRRVVVRRLLSEILLEARMVLDWALRRQRREQSGLGRGGRASNELSRLGQIMGVFKKVSQANEVMTEKTIREYKMKQMQSVKDLLANKVQQEQRFLRSLTPYLLSGEDYELKTAEDCQLNGYEMQILKKSVVPMRRNGGGEPQQSLMLSHIYINKPEQMRLKPLMSGGFSSIFLAEVEFAYVEASRFKEEQFLAVKDRRWEKNRVVIKKEMAGLQSSLAGRNQHEKQIIQKMKSSTSYMLNRYYIPVNTPQACRNDIIMDHIPFPTLKEFMVLGKQSCSLLSKLTVMVAVLQALRSVNRFDVVHLDLKPNNIILNPELQVKLLDFGESYHPEVQKFKPGFTIPYACPEVHSGRSEFTVKSDIYSFGVLLFELLYRHHPFYFHQDGNLKKYRTGEYLEHWFYYPESAETMGERGVYRALNLLVSRCLQREPSRRPELLSITLILQECIRILSS